MNLILSLTHNCNLRCNYCYAGKKVAKSMSKETAFKAIDFAISKSKDKLEIAYFGGEPLLEYELLQEISAKAKKECEQKGLKLVQSITTNGSLLDKQKLEYLKRESIFINLSIDGNEAMHNIHRLYAGNKSSFSDVKRALELLSSYKRYKTITVVTPNNIKYLLDSIEFLDSMRVPKIVLSIDYFANWNEHSKVYEEIFYKVGKYVINSFQNNSAIIIEPFNSKIVMHIKNSCNSCKFGEYKYAVAPSGAIYPCERLIANDIGTLSIGNVDSGINYEKWQHIIKNRGNKNQISCGYNKECK